MRNWYVEAGPNGWTLNEHNPDGSDGFLADFGAAETDCRRAAHEHNAFGELLAACKSAARLMDLLYHLLVATGDPENAATLRCEIAILEAAIAKATA